MREMTMNSLPTLGLDFRIWLKFCREQQSVKHEFNIIQIVCFYCRYYVLQFFCDKLQKSRNCGRDSNV